MSAKNALNTGQNQRDATFEGLRSDARIFNASGSGGRGYGTHPGYTIYIKHIAWPHL